MWYTEGIIKMQKCVIGGYLQIQQKSGALVLFSQQAGLGNQEYAVDYRAVSDPSEVQAVTDTYQARATSAILTW